MSECKPPTEDELSLVRRWCGSRSRLIRLGSVLLVGTVLVLAAWSANNSTTRDLALGHGARVTAEVQGLELVGRCGGARYSKGVPRYRYAVEVVDPGTSGLTQGRVTAVTLCGIERTGAQVEVTALPNGSLTGSTASDIWIMAGIGAAVALILGFVLRFLRRRVNRIVDLCADPTVWTPVPATLQSKFGIRTADVSTATGPARLQLGPALSSPEGTLLRWRLQRVPYDESPGVTLLIPGIPVPGVPVLLQDAAGERHWRTLTNVRG